jgi:hypothetical protein
LLNGVIRQIDGNQLTVENQAGIVTATLAPNAAIFKQSAVAFQELTVGEQVTFSGQRDSSGDMIASFVRAMPQGFGDVLAQFPIIAGDALGPGEARQIPPEVRQQIGQRDLSQLPPEVLARIQGQAQGQRPGANRSPNDLTIADPSSCAKCCDHCEHGGSVTYTVRLRERPSDAYRARCGGQSGAWATYRGFR